MNFRFTVVETHLNRAEFRWKWLCFLERSLLLGIVLCTLTLLFGGAILGGWVSSKPLAVTFFAVLAGVGFIAWVVMIVGVLVGDAQRPWLAAAVERVDPRLLDRLNTLVFLERHRPDGRVESFARRIAKQTQMLLAKKPAGRPFPATQSLKYSLAFIVLLVATILFYQSYSPWSRLVAAAPKSPVARNTAPDKPLELAPPATNNVEQNQAWGEVRITDPGTDMQVTKVDVVPLQIEAAANQAIKGVDWYSTINGTQESEHPLPPPAEPRYAVYQPTIYLDEMNLSDWDVMTYYAKAKTEKNDAYASEVYFLEVRPFREDILKMPGGGSGMAYQALSDLSSLINRQQHVIRQTHQHMQKPPEQESLRTQDRRKLAEAEFDLGESTQHLYAQMSSQMENKPIGEALDNLAKAEQSLNQASKLLQTNSMNQARGEEHGALASLVAARKMFQKAVSDNPSAFGDQKDQEQESSPVADAEKQLNQMAEFRNEAKAAQEFVKRTLDQQRALDQQARTASRTDFSRLSGRQNQLEKSLEFFQEQHPQPFQGTHKEAEQARQSMRQAAEGLQQRNAGAREQVQQATGQLEKLSDALNNQMAMQQLGDAYKLKQMLDKQAQAFDQRSKPDSKMSEADLQKTIEAARQTLDQLKKTAEQDPTRGAFGQPLRDALSDQNKADLEAKLQQLQQAQDEQNKQQRAGEARDGLGQVSKAFTESQPKSLQYAQQHDALSPNAQDSFNQGMAELDSLVKQLENNRQTPKDDLSKQGREAFYNLQRGLTSLHGENEQARQLLMDLQEQLKGEGKIDAAVLRRLMNELQHFSMEAADQLASKEDKPEVTNIDPAKLPPAYRGRIQKYFQKLSEK